MLSASESTSEARWTLPNCPSNPNPIRLNCVGTYTSANGDVYVGEWQNNQFKGYNSDGRRRGEIASARRSGQGLGNSDDRAQG